MAIRRSSAPQTAALIADLTGRDDVRREAAAARLAIAGARVVDPLLHALPGASVSGKVAILRTLEHIGAVRALPAAVAALTSADPPVALAAIGAVRPHLQTSDAAAAAQALDALTALALDDQRSETARVAALDALSDLGRDVLGRLQERLRGEPRMRIRRAAGLEGPVATNVEVTAARLEAAVHGTDDDPEALRRLLLDAGDSVGLSTLHELVIVFRRHERAAADLDVRLRWEAARAAAHAALAQRNSRLALFDLRDAIAEIRSPRLEEFVAAAAAIGDASCLEPLVSAWQRAASGALKNHITEASRAIVAREGLTRRHAAVKRLLDRFPDAAPLLQAAPRSDR